MDTLHFKDDTDYRKPLPPDGVEVESKAWAVNFRDMFGALGRLDEDFSFGSDCAGVVTRVGAKCKLIQPGDRVCMAIFGCSKFSFLDYRILFIFSPGTASSEPQQKSLEAKSGWENFLL